MLVHILQYFFYRQNGSVWIDFNATYFVKDFWNIYRISVGMLHQQYGQ